MKSNNKGFVFDKQIKLLFRNMLPDLDCILKYILAAPQDFDQWKKFEQINPISLLMRILELVKIKAWVPYYLLFKVFPN